MTKKLILNKDNLAITYLIGGFFSAKKNWQHKSFTHYEDYELIICLKGPLYLLIDSQKFIVNSNEYLIVPNYVKIMGYRPSPNNIQFYWLHFLLPKNVGNITEKITQANQNKILLNIQNKLSELDELNIITHQLLSIDKTLPYCQQEQNALITIILLRLADQQTEPQRNIDDRELALVLQIKEWIRTNIYKSPTLNDIAQETGFNSQYISRLFKKHVGMPPKHYMIMLKIKAAQALLVKTNLSVKEVCVSSFFNDEKLFLKQFKKATGITPSEFRVKYHNIYHNNETIDPYLPISENISTKIHETNN